MRRLNLVSFFFRRRHWPMLVCVLTIPQSIIAQLPEQPQKQTLEINTPVPGTSDVEVCEGDPIPALTVSGTNIKWYNTAGSGSSLIDSRDGQSYLTVKIGDQVWMAENLNYGTRINGTTSSSNNGYIEKYCLDNSESKCSTYGGLYQWNEMMEYGSVPEAQGVCPSGWHIPSHDEWIELEIALGMDPSEANDLDLRGTNEGLKLKAGGSSGFEALMAGKRKVNGVFESEGSYTTFWTSSQYYNRTLSATWDQIYASNYDDHQNGFSVRCIKYSDDVIFQGNIFYTGQTAPGTYTYYVTQTVNGEESDRVPVTLTIHPSIQLELGTALTGCEGQTIPLDAGAGYSSYLWNTGSSSRVINVSTTGTYEVTVTNSFGCEASDQIYVNFYPAPAVVITGNTEACEGETTMLDAGAGFSSYSWSTGSGSRTINISEEGSYTVTVINAQGCSASDQVYVNYNSLPQVSITGRTESCEGEIVVLDAGDGFSLYSWSTGETTRKINVSLSGKYTVTVTDLNNCSNTDEINVSFVPCTTNHPPVIEEQIFSTYENIYKGSIIGIVDAADQDSDQTLSYSIISGNDNLPFELNKDNGLLTVNNPDEFDYEKNPQFALEIKVQDNGEGLLSDSANITIIINDLNEPPRIEDQTLTLDENSPAGYFVGTIVATDEDQNQNLSYELLYGNSFDAFTLNVLSGVIIVNNPEAIDFEVNPYFQLSIRVSDDAVIPLHADALIQISLNDLTETEIETRPYSALHIYPNPTNQVVRLDFGNNLHQKALIEIYDSRGILIKQITPGELKPGNHQKIEFSFESKGIYFVKLLTGDLSRTQKVICY